MNVITSNPLLRQLYGGGLVPHVRDAATAPAPRPPASDGFVVGFVGTIREHKGISDLRAAVAALARERDARLRITAPPPADARPWEDWAGHTTLAEGRALLASCHATAIVSRPGVWGDLQLPVKLIDPMATGVPTVITARPPLLWATGGTATVVRDDSVTDLTEALALLADDPQLAGAPAARSRPPPPHPISSRRSSTPSASTDARAGEMPLGCPGSSSSGPDQPPLVACSVL